MVPSIKKKFLRPGILAIALNICLTAIGIMPGSSEVPIIVDGVRFTRACLPISTAVKSNYSSIDNRPYNIIKHITVAGVYIKNIIKLESTVGSLPQLGIDSHNVSLSHYIKEFSSFSCLMSDLTLTATLTLSDIANYPFVSGKYRY